MGVWDICVLHNLPKESKLYSVSLAEEGKEYSYVEPQPNFIPCVGDDLDLTVWPKEAVLKDTDLWFIDTLHSRIQLVKELELYAPFFKSGSIILYDDIHLHQGMEDTWNEIISNKYYKTSYFDGTYPLHWTGFGITVVL